MAPVTISCNKSGESEDGMRIQIMIMEREAALEGKRGGRCYCDPFMAVLCKMGTILHQPREQQQQSRQQTSKFPSFPKTVVGYNMALAESHFTSQQQQLLEKVRGERGPQRGSPSCPPGRFSIKEGHTHTRPHFKKGGLLQCVPPFYCQETKARPRKAVRTLCASAVE